MKRWSKLIILIFILTFSISMNSFAMGEEIELDSDEPVSYTEDDTVGEVDQFVDGIYNVNEFARASMSGVIRLVQSGTKLQGSYSTSYTHDVDKIGVKNVKLQYKGSLKVWYTIVTLDDRYRKNESVYMGSFTTAGTIGRTYRLKATHYIIDGVYTETRDNITGELTF